MPRPLISCLHTASESHELPPGSRTPSPGVSGPQWLDQADQDEEDPDEAAAADAEAIAIVAAARARREARRARREQKRQKGAKSDVAWHCMTDPNGQRYYYNTKTGESTWNEPQGETILFRQVPSAVAPPPVGEGEGAEAMSMDSMLSQGWGQSAPDGAAVPTHPSVLSVATTQVAWERQVDVACNLEAYKVRRELLVFEKQKQEQLTEALAELQQQLNDRLNAQDARSPNATVESKARAVLSSLEGLSAAVSKQQDHQTAEREVRDYGAGSTRT